MLAEPPQISAGGEAARVRFGIGTHDKGPDAGLRRGEPLRGTEPLTVGVHDLQSALVIDEMREGKGAAEISGKDRALVARSEEPYLRARLAGRHHPGCGRTDGPPASCCRGTRSDRRSGSGN